MNEAEWRRDFARKLKAKMNEQGLSVRELGRRADVAPTTISGYLNLRYMPSVRGVVNITHALGCDITELMDASELIM